MKWGKPNKVHTEQHVRGSKDWRFKSEAQAKRMDPATIERERIKYPNKKSSN